jgi:hypothetical protein
MRWTSLAVAPINPKENIAMRKNPKNRQSARENRKPKPADALLKTSKKKDIELTEDELRKATGGNVMKKPQKQSPTLF